MKQSLFLAIFAAAIASVPASAQPVAADLLPAYEVSTIVASMGLRPVGRPAWMRGRYVVAAIDRYGREVNVVLDARDGQVLAVRPLGRGRFGPPPPRGYGGPAPYDPMDGRAPPAAVGPMMPPADDDEYFDYDRQQGSLPSRAATRMAAPPPREPVITGSVPRRAPAARRDVTPKDATPVPRPRPTLARANDPGNTPAATASQPTSAQPADAKPAAAQTPGQAEAKAEVKPDASKPETGNPVVGKPVVGKPVVGKPEVRKPEAKQTSASPIVAKPDATKKPATGEREIRVIDLSKPKDAAKPAEKPGEAIRF